MTERTLLPANSSLLEQGLDLALGKIVERITPPFPELMDPQRTPVDFLPYLAADRGVQEWNAASSEEEKRLTVALSWSIQRQAGTDKALKYAVESMGFTPNITPWYAAVPVGEPYSFDVQAIITRPWSTGDHNRLYRRLHAAKSERDDMSITLVHETAGGLRIAGAAGYGLVLGDPDYHGELPEVVLRGSVVAAAAAHEPITSDELFLDGSLPDFELGGQLASAAAALLYTTNDYDLEGQV
ncbi:phage tail protein I [Pseudomonas sp. WS 5027]|uniref:phage tail protein I n=1 Tax=Pseudomonas sp. WS 5027 TaxID=2717483 RepID=UPI0014750C76|nr:phage tail protein I [Pseudomonas sp. WS 5027]NMY49120.1 phage tail protein I [Pseudomonas sp. WS 5027]